MILVGSPPFGVNEMVDLPQRPGESMSLMGWLRFLVFVVMRLPGLLRNLPGTAKDRAEAVRRIRKYISRHLTDMNYSL